MRIETRFSGKDVQDIPASGMLDVLCRERGFVACAVCCAVPGPARNTHDWRPLRMNPPFFTACRYGMLPSLVVPAAPRVAGSALALDLSLWAS